MAFFDSSAKSWLYESQLETKGYSPVDKGAMGFQSNNELGESNNLIKSVVEFLNMKDKILSHCFTSHLPAQFK